jgi:hypothetical protein
VCVCLGQYRRGGKFGWNGLLLHVLIQPFVTPHIHLRALVVAGHRGYQQHLGRLKCTVREVFLGRVSAREIVKAKRSLLSTIEKTNVSHERCGVL